MKSILSVRTSHQAFVYQEEAFHVASTNHPFSTSMMSKDRIRTTRDERRDKRGRRDKGRGKRDPWIVFSDLSMGWKKRIELASGTTSRSFPFALCFVLFVLFVLFAVCFRGFCNLCAFVFFFGRGDQGTFSFQLVADVGGNDGGSTTKQVRTATHLARGHAISPGLRRACVAFLFLSF